MRIVIDTNILVSCLFKPNSRINQILQLLIDGKYSLLYSDATMRELRDVLLRPRIRKNILQFQDIEELIAILRFRGMLVIPRTRVAICRDPKDNKFLELALDSRADHLVSGDKDLLVLNPFQGIPIITPAEFLGLFEKQ